MGLRVASSQRRVRIWSRPMFRMDLLLRSSWSRIELQPGLFLGLVILRQG
jgi:hypothetical protein